MSGITKVEKPSDLAVNVIVFGRELGMTFKPLPYRGVPAEPFSDGEYLYRLARQMPNDFEMPMEAWRRFFAVYESDIPIKDVVIGEELEPYKEWAQTVEAGKKAAVVTGGAVATVGAALLTLVALAPMALLADPQLIIVLEDGSWVSIAEWL